VNHLEHRLARFSLAFVWLWTAFVSVQQLHGMSGELLRAHAGIAPQWHPLIILSGAGVDLALGGLMVWRPSRPAYWLALAMTLLMTVAASVIDPTLWLHPLGPLSKNMPIMILLWMLAARLHPVLERHPS
jgi:hypothetical protein